MTRSRSRTDPARAHPNTDKTASGIRIRNAGPAVLDGTELTKAGTEPNTARRALQLRPRLEAALALLGSAQVLADVGCDHGRFGAAALIRGHAGRVIASDVSLPSLEKARLLAEKLGLTDRFDFRAADGLAALTAGEADAAAILGMGGELIAAILEAGADAAHRFGRIVMQPMRGEAELRQYLYENGYAIDDEAVVFDAGRYYQLISAHYCPENAGSLPPYWPENWYQFGPKAFLKREKELEPMLRRYLSVMNKKLASSAASPAALVREAENTETLIGMIGRQTQTED